MVGGKNRRKQGNVKIRELPGRGDEEILLGRGDRGRNEVPFCKSLRISTVANESISANILHRFPGKRLPGRGQEGQLKTVSQIMVNWLRLAGDWK